MERASLHVTRSSLFNFVGERKRNDQNSTTILVISVFLPRFNANSHHYYYRIRKVLRNHTKCFSQRFTLFLFLTMDCRGRVIDEAGAETGVGSSKPHWVL